MLHLGLLQRFLGLFAIALHLIPNQKFPVCLEIIWAAGFRCRSMAGIEALNPKS